LLIEKGLRLKEYSPEKAGTGLSTASLHINLFSYPLFSFLPKQLVAQRYNRKE